MTIQRGGFAAPFWSELRHNTKGANDEDQGKVCEQVLGRQLR